MGIPLSDIHPGSDEIALKIEDFFPALSLIRATSIAILGGDIYVRDMKSGLLEHGYASWGSDPKENESYLHYCERSYVESEVYIHKYFPITRKDINNLFVVIVIDINNTARDKFVE